MHGPVAADQAIEIDVVQGAADDPQRMAVKGVGEGGDFPPAQVGGQKQHPLAFGEGLFEILEAVVDHDPRHVLGV